MIPTAWFDRAKERLSAYIKTTPLTYDPELEIFLKWENHQVTGSFKARGALNKVLALQDWERDRGLVAATAGNHGQGLALAGEYFQAPVYIFAPESSVKSKLEAMERLGAHIQLIPGGYGESEIAGKKFASQMNANWVSPYNDGLVIAGQGTIAIETLAQFESQELSIPNELTWVIPVGGGGLCAGIGSALSTIHNKIVAQNRIIAVQSDASPYFYEIFHRDSQDGINELPSLADGLSGPVEANSLTIPLVKNLVEDIVLVTENEIRLAIRYAWINHQEIIEGSAAAALAAVIFDKIKTRPALVVISGGNIQPELHRALVE